MFSWLKKSGVKLGLAVGVLGTLVFVVTAGAMIEKTNTMEFCVSCHSMEQTVYQEYKKSLHYKNEYGVRVECPDCHVPQDYPDKLIAKVIAAKDVLHEILGTIDTKEKFEEHRLQMAERVWERMETTQSKECKTCHSFDAMSFEDMGRRARRKHPKAMEEGKHCIQCHKGVVHELPRDYED
ncbi:putative tetraheme cytochrome-c type [Candidatus Terasakiella magnetica]|uniref:Cytochrome c-type protein n=1 Tax=Candidatus Terasakiella magnetica TaxID=1867952 RepID=A0A1C3RJI6_9PROT|nr:NapC/NirT family cytochrome c [Candidatus Terasakiella magnetica]SCA57454.1 putative tetraheme cytochrome-c type [Candidatus Terasakiella magnetica]